MGLFGSPELYPYNEIDKKCSACGKMGTGKFCSQCGTPYKRGDKYISISLIVVFTFSILLFFLFFVAGGANITSFFISLMLGSSVSFLGNLICIIFCSIKKRKNRVYLIYALFSLAIAMITFLLYGMICLQ